MDIYRIAEDTCSFSLLQTQHCAPRFQIIIWDLFVRRKTKWFRKYMLMYLKNFFLIFIHANDLLKSRNKQITLFGMKCLSLTERHTRKMRGRYVCYELECEKRAGAVKWIRHFQMVHTNRNGEANLKGCPGIFFCWKHRKIDFSFCSQTETTGLFVQMVSTLGFVILGQFVII